MFFIAVQSIDLLHLFFSELKSEQIQVFPDMIRVGRAGYHNDAPLKIPPEYDLGR
jgi:hypothetical protein